MKLIEKLPNYVNTAETGKMNSCQTRKKKKKKTKLQVLKAEEIKLQTNLKTTEKAILKDDERKASPNYTPYENRQRLAREAFDAVSKLRQIKGEIVTTQKESKLKNDSKLTTKLRKRFLKKEKQQNRLIKMTLKLERMKTEEGELRAKITRELSEGMRNTQCVSDEEQIGPLRLPPIAMSTTDINWIRLSKIGKDENSRAALNEPGEQLTQLPASEKRVVADKLSQKYDMTRELRNTIHEHMITRSYSVSYFNIIPPYKQMHPKPKKSKKGFNRLVLENKIRLTDSGKKLR